MNEIIELNNKSIEDWTQNEIAIAKAFIKCPKDATERDWQKLIILSKTYNLNILMNEIWITDAGVFVGLNGMVKIANRTGQFDGIDAHTYTADGKIWVGEGGLPPAYSTCTVYKKGCTRGFSKTVTWSDFGKPTVKGTSSWDKTPGYMLEKVATSHALKYAFALDGLYIPEEFGEVDTTDEHYKITPKPTDIKVDPQPINEQEKINRKNDFEVFTHDMEVSYGEGPTKNEKDAALTPELTEEQYNRTKELIRKRIAAVGN